MDKGAWRVCLFLLLAAAVAVGLCLLPRMTVGGYEVKRAHLPWLHGQTMAAVIEEEEEEEDAAPAPADSLAADSLRRQVAFIDTVAPPPDLVLIEDFGSDTLGRGMEPFYRALSQRQSLGRPVRIAFFGDSFVEGDILTGDLRELLQEAYGGGGVGYVDIVSPVAQFRATVRQSQHGWTSHSILDKSSSARALAGLSGRSATSAQAGATATFTPASNFPHLSAATQATLYVCAEDTQELLVLLGGDTLSYALGGGGVQALRLPRVGTTTVLAPQAGLTAYGLAWEAASGISLDNFSLRGCAGLPLTSIPAQRLRQFAALRPYDLIVLQFGLNIAERNRLDYTAYVQQMARVVAHLRSAYPHAGILIVSIGDRDDRIDGELQTLPGVKALVKAQRKLAQQTGSAYWNLFEAMGGELGIARMAEASPPEAAKDYTHLNARGGKRLAGALFRAIEFGLGQYERKSAGCLKGNSNIAQGSGPQGRVPWVSACTFIACLKGSHKKVAGVCESLSGKQRFLQPITQGTRPCGPLPWAMLLLPYGQPSRTHLPYLGNVASPLPWAMLPLPFRQPSAHAWAIIPAIL